MHGTALAAAAYASPHSGCRRCCSTNRSASCRSLVHVPPYSSAAGWGAGTRACQAVAGCWAGGCCRCWGSGGAFGADPAPIGALLKARRASSSSPFDGGLATQAAAARARARGLTNQLLHFLSGARVPCKFRRLLQPPVHLHVEPLALPPQQRQRSSSAAASQRCAASTPCMCTSKGPAVGAWAVVMASLWSHSAA